MGYKSREVDRYMSLPYHIHMKRETSGIWVVWVEELPNCMSQGDTPDEAMCMIKDAMRGWLEVELEDGENIPLPEEDA